MVKSIGFRKMIHCHIRKKKIQLYFFRSSSNPLKKLEFYVLDEATNNDRDVNNLELTKTTL